MRRNRALANDRLSSLESVTGQSAFEQRQLKQSFRNAAQAPQGGLGGIAPSSPVTDSAQPQSAPVNEVIRNTGVQTLYKRGQLVVTPETADLDLEQDKSSIQKIARYSDEYFALVSSNTAAENELLSQQQPDEHLLVKLRDQVYLIE